MKRRTLLAVLAAPLAWLGCNGLLGIDDATFVPLPDGSTNGEQDGSIIPIGPIRPFKTLIRLPVRETRTVDVQIVPDLDAGIFGASDLVAVPGDPLVKASVAKVDTDRFVVTLVGPDSVTGLLDTLVRLEGKDSSGTTQMTQNIRVLVGAPGSLDTTFGTSGSVVVTSVRGAKSAQSYPLALLGSTPVVGDGDGRVHLFENEGVSPRSVQVSTGCSVDAITATMRTTPTVTFGTSCTTSPLGAIGYFLPGTDAAPTLAPFDAPVYGVALTREEVPNVLAGTPGDFQLFVAGVRKAALLGASASSLLSTGDGLVALGGRQTADGGAELVLEYTPVNEAGGSAVETASVYTRVVPDALGTANTAVATNLTPGTIAASWSVTAGGKDTVYLYVLGVDGSPRAMRILEAYTARLAGDARGRIVVATDVTNLSGMELRRLLADGTDDPTFPGAKGGCSFPALAIDPDGMLVVSCELSNTDRQPPSSDLVVRRYWP